MADLLPLGVQYHPIALLCSKGGKSCLVAPVPIQLLLNFFLLGWLLSLAKEEEVNDFHALASSEVSLLQQREAHLKRIGYLLDLNSFDYKIEESQFQSKALFLCGKKIIFWTWNEYYLIDVTNCNRRKVEISNWSRCVVDVCHWLLLQEGVQLGIS